MVDPPSFTLPPNPVVPDPVLVRYAGAERCRIEGQVTGYVYFADAERRVIDVSRRDLPGILRDREFSSGD